MLVFLDIFFILFHTVFTVFNVVGWMFARTRKLHLITMTLTAFSWFVLGIWYGWGYCFCTDWHWQVREALGYHDHSTSYIHFLLLKLTGMDFNPQWVDTATATVFALSLIATLWVNRKLLSRRR
ncbi:MAG: DUF2784 domain-containing protein [Cyclobacteriaceae bacterium]|nr:DUF2784 domain-containing protein [Cyclobacteriaceae bacterium]